MTEKQVQDALLSYLSTALSGTFTGLTTAYSLERAGQLFEAETPFIAATPNKHERLWPDEDAWEFLLQFSKSLHQDEDTTASGAIEADRDMRAAVLNALNSDSGFATLTAAGLEMPKAHAMSEDQRDLSLINPLIFSCSTF